MGTKSSKIVHRLVEEVNNVYIYCITPENNATFVQDIISQSTISNYDNHKVYKMLYDLHRDIFFVLLNVFPSYLIHHRIPILLNYQYQLQYFFYLINITLERPIPLVSSTFKKSNKYSLFFIEVVEISRLYNIKVICSWWLASDCNQIWFRNICFL